MDVEKNPNVKDIVLERLSIFFDMPNKTLESIQSEQLAKMDLIPLEEHVKQVFVAPNTIQDVFDKETNDDFSTMDESDKETNEELKEELVVLQAELREYYYDENLRDQIIDTFGERCKEFRIRQLKHGIKLLYDLFKAHEVKNPDEIYNK
jgi:hypothetical protein